MIRAGDFNVRQMGILLMLGIQSPRQLRDIAKELQISKPAVSRAVDRICIEGFSMRARGEMDRRDCLVNITDKGRDLVEQICSRNA